MPETTRRLYVAYGSNLNLSQMARRCPTAEVIGTTVMRNWQLFFCGVATIRRCKGEIVPVLVWSITPDDEVALDAYEGWPRLYRKESVRVTLNGKQVRAMVYVMNDERSSPPNAYYFDVIREGYESAGFDLSTLYEAKQVSQRKGKKHDEPNY